MHKGPNFSTSLPTLVIFLLVVDSSHPNGCEVVSHCGFDWHNLDYNDAKYLFLCLLAICISSLEKGPKKRNSPLLLVGM